MKRVLSLLFIILSCISCSQTDTRFFNTKDAYFSQTPPGNSAKLFAPEIINHLAHSSPTFTPDGKEIYWSTVSGKNETRKIYYVKYENNHWSQPTLANFSGNYHDDQPFISYSGDKLLFASKRPKVSGGSEEMDIWICDKAEQGWSAPKPIDNLIGLWTPTVTKNGTIYFLDVIDGARVICCAELIDGEYGEVEILNENINKKGALNWCPFIAPDESYLIFSSDREGQYGAGDLYISFKDEKGDWQEAINMGNSINTDKQERFPGVSPDGKYLFFTRWHSSPYYHDLYWIDAGIINDLLTVWVNLSAQVNNDSVIDNYKGEYLGLTVPGMVPEIFAPDLISGKGRLHCFPSFSIDNKEMYWMIIPPKIMAMREIDGIWTSPEFPSFSSLGSRNQAPFVAHDNTIYFSSNREGGNGGLDIWCTTKIDSGYTIPINIGDKINTGNSESTPTVSENKTMFFAGSVQGKLYNFGIYYSVFEDGEYKNPIVLPEPINIMDTAILDYTPFIASDESYLLFCSNRQNPEKELCHIYISYKNEIGEWGEPVDLSLKMGFTRSSKFPYITPDKKFLFFSCGNDIYWLDSKIIDVENK